MRPFNFDTQLDKLEAQFRKIKNLKTLHKRSEFLTGENAHEANSLLLAIHYGTKTDIELIKKFIIQTNKIGKRSLAPNSPYMRRIKLTDKFWELHQQKLNAQFKKTNL